MRETIHFSLYVLCCVVRFIKTFFYKIFAYSNHSFPKDNCPSYIFLSTALQKRINIDMKLLLKWLKANKISLNVDKTEIIIFKHKLKKMMENAWYSKIVSTIWEF